MCCYRLHLKIMFRIILLVTCCIIAVFVVFPAAAQPPAMTVNSFNGEIIVLPASQPFPSPAQLASLSQTGAPAILVVSGEVSVVSAPQPNLPLLQPNQATPDGSRIVVQPGAYATLTLPDGSQIVIREMSILELNGFAWNDQTKSRGLLMSLYAGSVRVMLSQPYQQQETFFEIKTPNALVALHFSQPDVEVIYAPSPVENMTALLEEGALLDAGEATLWQDVLAARQEDMAGRQRTQTAPVQLAALPAGVAQSGSQPETLAQIGLIQSEEETLVQARLLQRDETLTDRLLTAPQVASASTADLILPGSGRLPANVDLEQWQNDGLITGEDETGKGATLVFAYTVSVSFMNRVTREIRTIQHGQRAVVRGRGITMTVLDGNPMQVEPPRNIGTIFEFEGQGYLPSLGEPEESFAPWMFPGSPGRPEGPGDNRPRPHNIEIIIDEATK